MFENLKSVRIISKYFKDGIDCEFFRGFGRRNDHLVNTRMALVYGKNGTGKSTLSSAFEYVNTPKDLRDNHKNNPKEIIGVSFDHIDSIQIRELDPLYNDYQSIFVFNENYANENITLQEDGLGTLVSFNDLGKKSYEIDNLNKKIEQLKSKLGELVSHYSVKHNYTTEPIEWSITSNLSINWRSRYKTIYNKSYNKNLSFEDIDPAIFNFPSNTYLDYPLCKEEFNQLALFVQQYRNMDYVHIPIESTVPIYELEKYLPSGIKNPTLNEQEQQLVRRIDSIDDLYEQGLLTKDETIHFLESEDYIYINMLKKAIRNEMIPVFLDECFIPYLEDELRNAIECDIWDYNEISSKLNEVIRYRIDHPSGPINSDITIIINQYKEICKQLENTLSKINFDTIYPIMIERLQELNIELSYCEIKDDYKQYQEACKIESEIQSFKDQISKIEETFRNRQLPIDDMNHALAYIFASSKRLQLKLYDKKIYIYSNKNNVAPNSISTAERNILALVYFFTSIYNQEGVNHAESKEYLVVLDDPITSTDSDNTIGLYSYLQDEITKLMENNTANKCICLTHDHNVFLRMEKVFSKVKQITNNNNRISYFELLPTKVLQRIKPIKLNDYTTMMETVYQYGFEDHPELEYFIGNTMRKLMEAFTNFEYNIKLSDLDNNSGQDVFDDIKDENLKHYFKHLMNRPILNDESHMDNAARYNYDTLMLNYVSPDDLKRSAKDVLAFMYTLNSKHVKGHIGNKANIVKKWCEEIKER